MNNHLRNAQGKNHPHGVMLPFMAVGFVLILIMLMFTVDVAYMQMVRTELRVTTDIAAKAGVEALRRTQDGDKAVDAVIDFASKNHVAGKALKISKDDITLGKSSRQSDNTWEFVAGAKPYNAIKVETALGGDSLNPAVNMFFGKFWGTEAFTPSDSAVASNTEVEIVLCLDRSHSMAFDMTGVEWSYPPGTPSFLSFIYPPHPTKSRWGALTNAIKIFVNSAKKQAPQPRVALVTWGSLIDKSTYEGLITGLNFPIVKVDLTLTDDLNKINPLISGRGAATMLGGTQMSAGIEEAIHQLKDCKPLATRVIILFTDGQWNKGYDPVVAAQSARDQGIIIHTVGLLNQANSTQTLKDIADTTGGRYFVATSQSELEAAFLELSAMLPVALTE